LNCRLNVMIYSIYLGIAFLSYVYLLFALVWKKFSITFTVFNIFLVDRLIVTGDLILKIFLIIRFLALKLQSGSI
jgi:hypothetical protein